MEIFWLLTGMFLLFLGSAFFSGSETALFAITPPTLQRWRESGSSSEKLVATLMDDHHGTLTAILLGNNFVNLLTPIVLAKLIAEIPAVISFVAESLHISERLASDGVAVVISTGLLMVFGEVTPKAVAYSNPTGLAPKAAPLVSFGRWCLFPLIFLLKRVSGAILAVLSRRTHCNAISAEEFQTFTRLGEQIGVFDAHELDLFERVFNLQAISVGSVMTPRTDVCTVDRAMTAAEIRLKIAEHCHRQLPVVEGELDKLVGILDVRCFSLLERSEQGEWFDKCVGKPIYVPENSKANLALAQLREHKQGMAFVVNEYGGVEGLITAEDIYEQVVGELFDEFDQASWEMTTVGPRHWRMSGQIPLVQLQGQLEMKLEDNESDTVAGYLAEKLDHLPLQGETWVQKDWLFLVRKTHKNRVIEVDLRYVGEQEVQP